MRGDEIRAGVRERYRQVAVRPEGHFAYPVGRTGVLRLGYEPEWIDSAPPGMLDRFVGVGSPFSVERPRPGDRVLDLGCGAGLDVHVAGRLVGPGGRAVGVDLSREMLRHGTGLRLVQGDIEHLPFGDAAFDLVTSNGVLNLVPDKDRAFREIRRVLRPGGILAAADLLVTGAVDPEVPAGMDAWST